jgi:hypothetical protein
MRAGIIKFAALTGALIILCFAAWLAEGGYRIIMNTCG